MISSPEFVSEAFTFDTLASHGMGDRLKMTAKRYRRRSEVDDPHNGTVLLCTHGGASHKEQWEPVMARLFRIQDGLQHQANRISEAWSFDWQNHGDAAILNRSKLASRPEPGVSLFEWSAALREFLNFPQIKTRRIVLIGHCVGAAAWTFSIANPEDIALRSRVAALILLDPLLLTEKLWNADFEERSAVIKAFQRQTLSRRDSWASRQDAYDYLSRRTPWRLWDEEALRLLVTYGLEDVPSGGCRLKCDKSQEAANFNEITTCITSTDCLPALSRKVSTYIIWGERPDNVFVPQKMAQAASVNFSDYVTTTKVKDAGHMVLHEQPQRLAKCIAKILDGLPPSADVEGAEGFQEISSKL